MDQRGNKRRVVILYGGKADEHSISCVSAASVLRAIDTERFEPIPIGITRDGTWIVDGENPTGWDLSSEALPEVRIVPGSRRVVLDPAGGSEGFFALEDADGDSGVGVDGESRLVSLGHIDAVFPALHGPFGEDGAVQGLLQVMGIPYVGCGVFASAACMDKHFTKMLLSAAGIQVAPGITFDTREFDSVTGFMTDADTLLRRVAEAGLTYPLFVKPSREGSSFGVSKISDPLDSASLAKAVFEASKCDWKVLVESEVEGHEIECAILSPLPGQTPMAAWPGEIVIDHAGDGLFYDFDSKYMDATASHNEIPAHLPDEALQAVCDTAVKAFEVVDGFGLARVDTFVRPDGTVVVNEINTMPGFTSISMYPQAWEATGVPYQEVITRLIEGVL